ncbi:MAG: hypothetical protein RR635_11280 [Oscillospiraceae bacterium]
MAANTRSRRDYVYCSLTAKAVNIATIRAYSVGAGLCSARGLTISARLQILTRGAITYTVSSPLKP